MLSILTLDGLQPLVLSVVPDARERTTRKATDPHQSETHVQINESTAKLVDERRLDFGDLPQYKGDTCIGKLKNIKYIALYNKNGRCLISIDGKIYETKQMLHSLNNIGPPIQNPQS